MKTSLYIIHANVNISYKDQTVYVKDKDLTYSFPIKSINSVQIFTNNSLNVDFIRACMKYRIPLYFISSRGKYLGKINNIQNEAIENRLVQYNIYFNESRKLELAKNIINGKIKNSLQMLYRFRRLIGYNLNNEIEQIVRIKNSIGEIKDIKTIIGYEGIVARYYFQGLGKTVPKEFQFNKRSKRPPLNPANSMLSFGYTLLANSIMTAIETNGMDPYIGFIHSATRNNPALVSDMMEEFRAIIIDSIVINLLESGKIKYESFEFHNHNGKEFVLINKDAKRLLIALYEKRLKIKVDYEGKSTPFQRIFYYQVEKMKQSMKNNTEYKPFSFR